MILNGTRTLLLKFYLRIISVLYFLGTVLHILDILDLRFKFSTMTSIWKIWTVFLIIADAIAAVGLWKGKLIGECAFLLVAITQLLVYSVFLSYFGNQQELILFHSITICIYMVLKFRPTPSNKF